MEEVARDAGVSRQALYLHFKSKSELLVAMARYNDEMLNVAEIVRLEEEAETAEEAIDAKQEHRDRLEDDRGRAVKAVNFHLDGEVPAVVF